MFSGALYQSSYVFQSELAFGVQPGSQASEAEGDLYAAVGEWYQVLEQFQAVARDQIKELQEIGQQLESLDKLINITKQKTYLILQHIFKPVMETKEANLIDGTEGLITDQELISKLQIDRQFEALETYIRKEDAEAEKRAEAFLERMRSAWLSYDPSIDAQTDKEIEAARISRFLEDMRQNWHKLCVGDEVLSTDLDEAARVERFLQKMQIAWRN